MNIISTFTYPVVYRWRKWQRLFIKILTVFLFKKGRRCCVREREREWVGEGEREKERKRERERTARIYTTSSDLHRVVIQQRALLHSASFTGEWCWARLLNPGTAGSRLPTRRLTALPDLSLGSKTSVIIYIYILTPTHSFLCNSLGCPLFTLDHSWTSCFWNPHYPACNNPSPGTMIL